LAPVLFRPFFALSFAFLVPIFPGNRDCIFPSFPSLQCVPRTVMPSFSFFGVALLPPHLKPILPDLLSLGPGTFPGFFLGASPWFSFFYRTCSLLFLELPFQKRGQKIFPLPTTRFFLSVPSLSLTLCKIKAAFPLHRYGGTLWKGGQGFPPVPLTSPPKALKKGGLFPWWALPWRFSPPGFVFPHIWTPTHSNFFFVFFPPSQAPGCLTPFCFFPTPTHLVFRSLFAPFDTCLVSPSPPVGFHFPHPVVSADVPSPVFFPPPIAPLHS